MPDPAVPADVDTAHLAALRDLGAATVGESGGHAMGPAMRAVWRGARLAAPAFTVRCTPGDNLAVHVAVTRAPAGSVLVVDVGGEEGYGYWGEVLTTGAEARRLAGLVIGGGVRDTAALEAHGFPVFATTVALRGASKVAAGALRGRVDVGGVAVHDGDVVVGDGDGVVVVRRADVEAVLHAARAREDKERGLFRALTEGATTVELLGLDPSPVTEG
jgi:4-hydroxy-4-methyl-2-oxoglutarate aldolase